ncbi:hypothetical protein ACFZB9_04895 [Kitasatospora sp. NPDC008050]|uniref:hypothetical protein n=1 Tax=Kitasatospora sp. NPDC008050 TaxID=3364021 RepID=UPI0036E37D04
MNSGGGLGSGFRVNPDELEGAGNNAEQVAGQIPGETTAVVGPSEQATNSLRGWQTGGALHDCTAAWKSLLAALAGEMDQAGMNLVANAQAYRAADGGAAAVMSAPVGEASDLVAVNGGPGSAALREA